MKHVVKRLSSKLAAMLLATSLAVGASPAAAWEARTTSAGIAEQAALTSVLHQRLLDAGFARGLFEPLILPPADAPALTDALRLLPPTEGAQPDARGQQTALAWIAAGAMLADLTVRDAANHFYDPRNGQGFAAPSGSFLASMSSHIRERLGRTPLPRRGMPAPDWVISPDNPFGLQGFVEQYAKAIRATTPGERARHMAGALIAAGALVHVLADMGSPSHVRGDTRAHLDALGPNPDDLGSRFERIAALAYGRLGVPERSRVVTRDTVRGFFTAAPGNGVAAPADAPDGLADSTARRFFSAYTLPGSFTFQRGTISAHMARPEPALPARLSNMVAVGRDGATLTDDAGVCLARYHAVRGVVSFSLDDDCVLEQVGALLPEVVAYATGLVDFLFRGNLVITIAGDQASVAGATGPVELLAEDGRGVRTPMTTPTVPAGTVRVVALSVGVDGKSQPIVAVGVEAL